MDGFLRLENISKAFGKIAAVKDLSLTVAAGTIFGFLGPNGAGKSTTIRMMAGILEPDAGQIVIDGLVMSSDPVAIKKNLGYVPDDPFIYRYLTGREFLAFIGTIYGLTKHQVQQESRRLFDLFPAVDDLDAPFYTYSRGTRQKMVFMAALLHQPKLFVIDEPMVGLDPRSASTVKQILKHEVASRGATVFLSTHTLSVAQELCDEVAIIDKGELIARGTLDELRAKTHQKEADLESIFMALTNSS